MIRTVRVKPGARVGPKVERASATDPDADLIVFVRERAVDGAANAGVCRMLANHFGVRTRDVEILNGHSGRVKRVRIDGGDDDEREHDACAG